MMEVKQIFLSILIGDMNFITKSIKIDPIDYLSVCFRVYHNNIIRDDDELGYDGFWDFSVNLVKENVGRLHNDYFNNDLELIEVIYNKLWDLYEDVYNGK